MNARYNSVHVATIVRKYKGKVYKTHLLRRTYRQGNKVLHETLGNLTRLPETTVDLIRRSLKGEEFVSTKDAFRTLHSLPHGHVEAILGMIRKLGLDTLLGSKPSRQRNLVLAMIVQQILFPCSKLATTRDWHTTTLAEELHVADADEDELYSALDWLLTHQRSIEAKLAKRHLDRRRPGLVRREQQLLRRANVQLGLLWPQPGRQKGPADHRLRHAHRRLRPAGGDRGLSGQPGRPQDRAGPGGQAA